MSRDYHGGGSFGRVIAARMSFYPMRHCYQFWIRRQDDRRIEVVNEISDPPIGLRSELVQEIDKVMYSSVA